MDIHLFCVNPETGVQTAVEGAEMTVFLEGGLILRDKSNADGFGRRYRVPEGGWTVVDAASTLGPWAGLYRGGDDYPAGPLLNLSDGENNVFSGKVGTPALVGHALCVDLGTRRLPESGGSAGDINLVFAVLLIVMALTLGARAIAWAGRR
jgi:hypothetical protein